jgi:hypothetical protein
VPAELRAYFAELLRWVTAYTAPKTMGRATAAVSHSDARFRPPNNEGIPRPKGFGALAAVSAREEKTPYLSGQIRAASFRGEGEDDGSRLLDASIEAGHKYAAVQAGKISAWYGPGRNGALIFTNNAAPYPGVRVHNPEPIPLSGWFSFLGNVQYDVFAARMEKKPQYSHSILVGTRLAARPKPWLEDGLSRALHYGGDGRSNGLSELLADFGGSNSPADRSNTLGGLDITLTLPFRHQPVQLYWDHSGEGQNHFIGTGLPFPGQWGNLGGIYFPKILTESRLDLRVEYADNYSGDGKTARWYGHSAYPHQYRGNIIGHPMGGGAREWTLQSRYFLLPSTFAEVTYQKILHEDGVQSYIGSPGDRRTRLSTGFTGWLTSSWRAEAHLSTDRVTNKFGATGATGTDISAFFALSYQVSSFSFSKSEN